MKDLTELSQASARLWLDAMTAQADAATTIALRLPIIMGNPQGDEARQMIMEKVLAASQSAMGASAALSEMVLAALAGAGPVANARAALAVAEAASDPVNHQVKRNARRLMRESKT